MQDRFEYSENPVNSSIQPLLSGLHSSPLGRGLPLATGPGSRVLILGSYPSPLSLDRGQYYANPRNRFWKVMKTILGIPLDDPYDQRVCGLTEKGVALWDIVKSCRRPGASDASIRDAIPNNIPAMLAFQPTILCLITNGRTARIILERHYPFLLHNPSLEVRTCPSTSPANARCDEKSLIESWGIILDYLR